MKIQRTEEQVFCKNSIVAQETVRRRFLQKKIIKYQCGLCGISTWQNKPLTLRLDHIDGDNHNNQFSNLRWLCPNCDSQQDTYCGKNTRHKKDLPKKYCEVCGKEIAFNSKTNFCGIHYPKNQKRIVENRPTREELKKLIRQQPFTKIASIYKVTDNTIRKWCDSYQLPRNKFKIKEYSDKEWQMI